MRFTTTINNVKAIEWDLSIQEAYLFAWIYELPSWADKMQIDGDIFYFASKNKAVEELPILTNKIDTMYRYYKALSDKKLITIKKVDGKDFIALTSVAKTWNNVSEINPSLGNKSEHPEKSPNKVGKKSELNSEKNPTYNNTSINKEINNNNTVSENFDEGAPDFVKKDRQKARVAAAMPTIDELSEDMLNDRAACEILCIQNKISTPQLQAALKIFCDKLKVTGEEQTKVKFRSYFGNWLPLNIEKLKPAPAKSRMVY